MQTAAMRQLAEKSVAGFSDGPGRLPLFDGEGRECVAASDLDCLRIRLKKVEIVCGGFMCH